MAIQMGMSVKAKRCLILSDKKATSIAKIKAHAQGGTLWSCVLVGV